MKRRDFMKTSVLAALATAASSGFNLAMAQGNGIFTLAYPTSFPDLDPATSFSNDGAVLANAYEGLTRYISATETEPSRIEPLLAQSWEVSEDGLTWTFKLREGVTFHDGEALTAAAVKGSIERTRQIGGGASFIWSPVVSIEAPDAMTVVFVLSEPQPLDLIASAGFAAWIQSPASLSQDNAWFNAGNDAGTGPFRIVRYEPGQRLVMERVEGYWGNVPEGAFQTVAFEIVEDVTLIQNMLESGQADWGYSVPFENLDLMKENPDLKVVVNPSFETLFGLYNTKRAPLDNPKVRLALSMAFPYDDVIMAGTAGLGTRAKGVVPTGIWGHDADAPIPPTDLEAAAAILAEEGVSGLELVMTYSTTQEISALAGELWKANLETLGVTLTLQPMAWEAQWQMAKSDPASAQDIFVMYWWPTYVTPHDYLLSLFRSEDEPLFNLGYYSNPKFDEVLDEAARLSGVDRPKAEEMFIEAQRIVVEDAAAVFMLDRPNVHIIRSDIKGYTDNPAYGHVTFVGDMSR
ncbi:ABC transporter substrate-binding protein [Xinfangfangia sp. CPCC 101601]|uniref:ABC transporter substrate-binding protein n=1 Tax=Pseudogemmobacter lacusdianii TaxID=3069608 RepID=A0ABU0VW75_9RHOB|nr:ABC transporter substrate-binding protein [Xinfangfangia sp. CPCC 101601]MDQ2065888.1 ABC transporter substrate-binding protein [Xinfangfangia sp. CPCC 101601]